MAKQKLTTLLSYEERIEFMLLHIINNLSSQFTLEELASYAYLSPFHLHRIFTAMFGYTLGTCIRYLRLEKSSYLLLYNISTSITEIAFECGFSSSQNFARAFKEWQGISPSKFREFNKSTQSPKIYKTNSPYILEYHAKNNLEVKIQPNYTLLGKAVSMNVKIKTLPDYFVAYVHHFGVYKDCTKAWNKVMEWASKENLLSAITESIGLSYDDPHKTDPNKCRYDACIVLPSTLKNIQGMDSKIIKGGLHACYFRKTKPKDFGKAFDELMGIWLPQSNYECIGTPFEFYPNMFDCSLNDQGNDILWDIIYCMPIKKLQS